MSESESETVPMSSATPEESRQPGSSTQTTPRLNEERNITQPEPEPVPSTSGTSSKGKMPANPRFRAYKKKRENWEDSIISAFKIIQISGAENELDSSDDDDDDDDYGERKKEKEVEEEDDDDDDDDDDDNDDDDDDDDNDDDDDEEGENRSNKSSNFDYKQDESALLELSIDPRDTYPQVCDEEDEPRPGTSFSFPLGTGTPGNELQPVSEENFIEEDAPAPALASPPPHPLRISPLSGNVMSGVPFYNLRLPKETIRHLRDSLGITIATILQEKAIPILMRERDAFMHAGPGSGKTVAFTIPLVHHLLLIKPQVCRDDGIRILVVVPTKECARKTYQTFTTVLRPAPWIEVGHFGGGDRFRAEKEMIRRGVVVLITTPLRFLDHLRRTSTIFLKNLSCLVVDGLDEIFERGDGKHLWDVITVLDKGLDYLHHPDHISTYKKEHVEASRQTILVSASITQEVARFTALNTTNPMMIDDRFNSPPRPISLPVGKAKDEKPPPPLYNQFFMIVPERMKLVTLVGFVMWKYKVANERRILVFAGTQTMADYFADLFSLAYGKKDPECEEETAKRLAGLDIYTLSPFMSQKEKIELFEKLSTTKCGVLFCTDSAVKGVDLPRVDWVIHLHAPTCSADYMARIGMANPGYQIGPAVILLLSAEKDYVHELKNHHIPLTSMRVRQSFRHLWAFYPPSHTIDDMTLEIQTNLEDIVHRSPCMRDKACLAFASWCRLYSSYPQNLKHIFRFACVHVDNYVHSFGLREQSAFAISHARKLLSDTRRKSAKKRRAPAEDEELPLELLPKFPFPPFPPSPPPAPQAPVAAELDDMYAHAGPSGRDPCASDRAGNKRRKNDEEMDQSDGEEGRPEKRSKSTVERATGTVAAAGSGMEGASQAGMEAGRVRGGGGE